MTTGNGNSELPLEQRIEDLLGRMSLEEKASFLVNDSPGVERLGVPRYNWCNESLHGIAHAGRATVFPQAIALAAMWNPALLHEVARAISDEGRAKHHEFLRHGDRGIHGGLNFWAPNVNIFRDPRWGRGQETYGEDPYLTARLGVAYVRGLQGEGGPYLRAVATPKHFAAHSGPEQGRHAFDARVSPKDLRETYLPAFEACVREGGAASVMAAYNRLNGQPCVASPLLLEEILRKDWGFDGCVVSDCGGVDDVYQGHGVARSPQEAAALAVRGGCDLNCGNTFDHIPQAVREGLLTEAEVDQAARRVLAARFRLGMFDPPEKVPYARTPASVIDCERHRALALQAARESIVLLKNARGVLPLNREARKLLLVGPNAASVEVLLGNYNGLNGRMVTVMEGIVGKVGAATAMKCKLGCTLAGQETNGIGSATIGAGEADAIIAVVGLSQALEGEEGVAFLSPTGGDRTSLALPGRQLDLLKRLRAFHRPLVVVVAGGSPLDLSWVHEHADAVVLMWYPGEEGGTAVADVLFGDYDPAGRLPVTFVRSLEQLPPFEDYSMAGRTYRFMKEEPLYPFGYGLSYTRFAYRDLAIEQRRLASGEGLKVRAMVTNTGARAGDEVVQLYISGCPQIEGAPRWSLKGFQRIHLAAGEAREVALTVPAAELAVVDESGQRRVVPGRYTVYVGGRQGDSRSRALAGTEVLQGEFEILGGESK